MRNTKHKNGFTLIEVLMAIMLVGLAIASLVAAGSTFTQSNSAGMNLSTAEFLIEQIKELTILLPVTDPDPNSSNAIFGPEAGETLDTYDDLDDLDDAVFSPPINAERQVLTDYPGFSQQITVENINGTNFQQVVLDSGSAFVRVTVKVRLNSKEIISESWIRANLNN